MLVGEGDGNGNMGLRQVVRTATGHWVSRKGDHYLWDSHFGGRSDYGDIR